MRVYHQGIPPKMERDVTVGVDSQSAAAAAARLHRHSHLLSVGLSSYVVAPSRAHCSLSWLRKKAVTVSLTAGRWSGLLGNELEKTEKIRPRHLTFAPLWK